MKIIAINEKNINAYDHCLIKNTKAPGYVAKTKWIKTQLKNGLVIKRMIAEDDETAGFIEYIPIEKAWRAVQGKGYLFIHCIFTYPKKFQGQNVASSLIKDCIKEAKKSGLNGVAVITSEGSFMASDKVFKKLGFELVSKSNKDQLLALRLKKRATLPELKNVKEKAGKYSGMHLFYSNQCPALAKPVEEIMLACKTKKLNVKFHLIKDCKMAQNAPFVSGTFGVICDGKVFAERCISKTRFLNIAKKTLV